MIINRLPENYFDNVQWKPWQHQVAELFQQPDHPYLEYVYHEEGGIGKTVLAKYLLVNNYIHLLPACNRTKTILTYVREAPKIGRYLVDLPRSTNFKSIYPALEAVKRGYCHSTKLGTEYFDRPNVVVFSTKLPDNVIKNGKWRIWTIDTNNNLIQVS